MRRSHRVRDHNERNWSYLFLGELKVFISLLLLIPLVGKQRSRDYWSSELLTSIPRTEKQSLQQLQITLLAIGVDLIYQ